MSTQSVDVAARPPATREERRPPSLLRRMGRHKWGYLFLLPWALVYGIFGIYPLVLSFYLTFFNYSFVRPQDRTFVGVGNWVRGVQDPLFWKSVVNILYNQVIFIALTIGLGLLIALLLKQITWGGRIFRTIYFIPVITSVIVLITLGTYLVGPNGPIQSALVQFGLLQAPIFWQASVWLPMPIIALINAWKWFGISTIILLAGLYGIDPQFYEAASLDGATAWQKFRSITLPQLMPQIFFLLVVDFINGLQMFAEVYAIYGTSGGNRQQALTPVLYLYGQAFDRSNMGYASTLGLQLAALIALITVVQFRLVPQSSE